MPINEVCEICHGFNAGSINFDDQVSFLDSGRVGFAVRCNVHDNNTRIFLDIVSPGNFRSQLRDLETKFAFFLVALLGPGRCDSQGSFSNLDLQYFLLAVPQNRHISGVANAQFGRKIR